MAGLNYVIVSGRVAGDPRNGARRPGPWVRFPLLVTGPGPDGTEVYITLPLVAAGRRAQRCMDSLRPGSRIVVSGRMVEDDHGLACFADWIEFIAGSDGVSPVFESEPPR